MFWPMAMNAGTVGFLGPSVCAIDGTDMRHRNGLRRNVAGVPVILMARVQDEAEIRRLEGSDQRAAVHDSRDALETLRDLDVVDGGVDAGNVLSTRSVRTPGSNGV